MSHCHSAGHRNALGELERGTCYGALACTCGCRECSAERLARQPVNAVELPSAGLVKMADRTPYGSHWCTQDLGCPGCIASALVPPTPTDAARDASAIIESKTRHWAEALKVVGVYGDASDQHGSVQSPDRLELQRLQDQHQRLECALSDLRNENEELRKENEGLRREARARKAGRR